MKELMIETFIIPGLLLGFTAGFSPGPLMALVISESLLHGRRGGMKVALAPVITDAPIIAASIVVLHQMKDLHAFLGIVSITGALFLAYLGFENIRFDGSITAAKDKREHSLRKAVVTNLLNPHPYLFWFTAGGSFLMKGSRADGASFLISFYLLLTGAKMAVALITDRSRGFFKNRTYVFAVRLMGALLFLFSLLLAVEGVRYCIKTWGIF